MRPGRLRPLRLLFLPTVALALARPAAAEPVPSLDLRGFRPPTDPAGALFLERTRTPGPGAWNVGALLSLALRPVILEDASGEEIAVPVERQLSLDYLGSIGIGERLALGVLLPTVLAQSGDDVRAEIGGGRLPATALGDAAFGAKATLVPPADLGGFGLAALARVTAPTGDPHGYVGEGAATGELRLLGELGLVAVDLLASAGARVRAAERTYVGEELGHDLPWGVGIGVRPQALGLDASGRLRVTLEAHGAVAMTPEFGAGPQSPAAAGLSGRYALGEASLLFGAEAALNGAVGNPPLRAVAGIGWAPRFLDADEDGIEDEKDECPELGEDRDGFDDRDGCPDFDNDDDGVPDEDDRCPTDREDEDEFHDDDGCVDADDDSDGIDDVADACPREAGPDSPDPRRRGCPPRDQDGDGVEEPRDACPDDAEDRDGWKDEDGCPDPDDDGDGVADEEDACRREKGAAREDPKLNGCPSPDKDGDTFDDVDDRCPEEPEDFDGDTDDDGCRDDDAAKPAARRPRPLLEILAGAEGPQLRFRIAPRFSRTGDEVEPKTLPSVRALAAQLARNPGWIAAVGVKPAGQGAEAEQSALSRSFVLVQALRALSHRDDAAESVGWSAVGKEPGAAQAGLGVLILVPGGGTPAVAPRGGGKP